jgi:hypothetical protein
VDIPVCRRIRVTAASSIRLALEAELLALLSAYYMCGTVPSFRPLTTLFFEKGWRNVAVTPPLQPA